jgi:hypothetical protein
MTDQRLRPRFVAVKSPLLAATVTACWRRFAVIRKSLLVSLLPALAACANIPMADQQADLSGKQFQQPDGERGAVYIYRDGLFGVARPLDVGITNGVNARLPYRTYLRVDGPPGPIEVGCGAGDYRKSTQVDIAPGRVTYVEATMTMGLLSPHCDIAEVTPDQGQAAVRLSKRVAAQ